MPDNKPNNKILDLLGQRKTIDPIKTASTYGWLKQAPIQIDKNIWSNNVNRTEKK